MKYSEYIKKTNFLILQLYFLLVYYVSYCQIHISYKLEECKNNKL